MGPAATIVARATAITTKRFRLPTCVCCNPTVFLVLSLFQTERRTRHRRSAGAVLSINSKGADLIVVAKRAIAAWAAASRSLDNALRRAERDVFALGGHLQLLAGLGARRQDIGDLVLMPYFAGELL